MNNSQRGLRSRAGRVGVTAGFASCLLLLPVQGAAAEQMNASDPAGDVVTIEYDAGPNGNETIATRHPARAHGDIRHLHANHTYRRVVAKLRFRDLDPSRRASQEFVFRTGRAEFSLNIRHTGTDIKSMGLSNDFIAVDCADLRVAIELAEDRVRVSVPRSCLDNPKWVRVGADTTTGAKGYYDEALRRGRSTTNPPYNLGLGPRLARGAAPQTLTN